MSHQRFPEELQIGAGKPMTEKGKPVDVVAPRRGMSVHSLYA